MYINHKLIIISLLFHFFFLNSVSWNLKLYSLIGGLLEKSLLSKVNTANFEACANVNYHVN